MPGDFRISKITVAINGGAGSPPDYNVHFVSTADQLPATMTAVLTQFKNFYDAVKAWFPNGQIFTIGAQVLDMETTPPTVLAVPPQTVTGTDFSGYCPPQCAVVVSWKTILASRSGRGRSYIGPVGRAGETTNGTPTPAFGSSNSSEWSDLWTDAGARRQGALQPGDRRIRRCDISSGQGRVFPHPTP